MSESHLPDDLGQWPNDPFQMLGITPDASHRDMRRAYANLIRIYKPEQLPEHFRRIRDAYEMLQHYFTAHGPEPAAPASNASASAFARASEQLPSLDEELAQLWRQSREMEPAGPYRRYAEWAVEHSGREDLYLRLYWLRMLWPSLDPERQPVDWLYAGMLAMPGAERIHRLYLLDLQHHPQQCLSQRCGALLDVLPRPEIVFNIAVVRWQAASSQNQWSLIDDDLDRLRLRFGDELHAWPNLLLAALDQLAWRETDTGESSAPALFKEAERRTASQLEFSEALARRELMLEIITEWRRLPYRTALPRSFTEPFQDLLRRSWDQPAWTYHWDLLNLLSPLVADADAGLRLLDKLGETNRGLLAALVNLTANIQADRAGESPPLDQEQMARELCALLDAQIGVDYGQLRLPVLYFCVRWRQPCRLAASLLFAVDGPDRFEQFGNFLGQDLALQALCYAHLAFEA